MQIAGGTIHSCVYPNSTNKPCESVFSTGVHGCTGDLNCAGVYQAIGFEQLELPSGYVWTSYDTAYCTLLDPSDMYCGYPTGDVTVNAVG